jgi:ATP-dependent Clp protease ATP-binding subunit ClpB
MAGSGVRGQFEEKFKALIRDIEDEVRFSLRVGLQPLSAVQAGGVICFIDEVRTCFPLVDYIYIELNETCRYPVQLGQG